MSYQPRAYWTSAPPMKVRPAHTVQERDLMVAIDHLEPSSILEVGVGFGRIGRLLCTRWPDAHYAGLDISTDRLNEARQRLPEHARLYHGDLLEWDTTERFDLVVAVEVLMHVRPEDIEPAVLNLTGWSNGHVVTVDWTEPISSTPKPHNFRHDYAALGLTPVVTTGLQTIHRWERQGVRA